MRQNHPKSTVNQTVWKILQSDLAIQKDLSRKLINVRALAKHILKKWGITASLDAIISAIRRFQSQEIFEEEEKALFNIFTDSVVGTKNNVACLTLKIDSNELLKRLAHIEKRIPFKFSSGSREIKLIVDALNLEEVENLFDNRIIRKVEKELSEITLTVADVALDTKGVLARVANEMALANINIQEVLICPPEFLIFVKQKDIVKAHHSILRLCQKTQSLDAF